MGLFDKLTGTKRPADGVAPRSADEVHAALLSLNTADVPYTVRDGREEGADLVAEWRLLDPAWQSFFVRTQDVQLRQRRPEEPLAGYRPGRRVDLARSHHRQTVSLADPGPCPVASGGEEKRK
ncbi:hypothetical protein [Streptomyces sp. NBC_01429]|uniref:hypothetical protein n=1 Tax=Streptomyces sp. NBC_01429 TaxID=2903862 RepID=UPI003FCE9872